METKVYTGIGSRDTPEDVGQVMTHLAIFLSNNGYTLRSGGAKGADTFFENGTLRKEIYLPYDGFNGRKVDNQSYFLFKPEAMAIAEQFHPAWHNCSFRARQMHSRNVHQILGYDLQSILISKFVICWTKDGKASGGTGQALRMAKHFDIPIYNLKNLEDSVSLKSLIEEIKNESK